MAHQDYVSRSRNKDKSPYKKNDPEPPRGIPFKLKFMMLITLCIVSGFGYLLWSIDGSEDSPQAQKSAQEASKKKEKVALPAPPKEKWAYRKELEDKKIEEGQYEVKQGGPYKMQCASFKTLKQAQILKAKIAFTGLSAQIGKPVGKKNTYYKVFLGPYAKKRDAERDKHKLKNNKINYCVIWPWK